jgi:hypothetical protein
MVNEIPNYRTGRGRGGIGWCGTLRRAYKNGLAVVVEETGVPVWYDNPKKTYFRPWRDRRGNRYDSSECVPRPRRVLVG